MLGVYNYTVVLTYIGMLVSFLGITFAFQGSFPGALLCLIIAGLCDMFDGKVASTKKDRTEHEKRFGIQIDSLCDLISFGILPAVIVYKACGESIFALFIPAMYVLFALIRQAWINVDEEDRQNTSNESRKHYLGLPVTTSALFLPALMGLAMCLHRSIAVIGVITLFFMAVAFICPFELKKPESRGKIGMVLFGCAELLILFMGARI